MRSRPLLASMLLLALLVVPLAAQAANVATAGIVKLYTDKASYYPNSVIKITVEFTAPFTGSLLLQVIGPDGKQVAADAVYLENATVYTYSFKHDEARYGDGVFKVVLTYSGKALIGGQWTTVYSASPLEITFTVAPAYSISGKVVDEKGRPVEGATVVVKETGATATTDAEGMFVVSVPGPGRYTVCAKKVDFLKNKTVVDVKEIGVTELPAPLVIKSQVTAITELMEGQKEIMDTLTGLVEQVKALQDKYEGVANTVQQLATAVAQLETQVQEQGNQVESLAKTLDELSAAVETLAADVQQMKQELEGVKQNFATKEYVDGMVAELRTQLDQLSASLQQLQAAITQLKQELGNYATKDEAKMYADEAAAKAKEEALAALNEQAKKLADEIGMLKEQVKQLQDKVDNLEGTVIKQLSQQLNEAVQKAQEASNNAASASRWALVAVIVAIIGIIIAIFVALKVMKLTAA